MHQIPDSSVHARFANGFARSIELICPRCHEKSMFDARPWQEHGRQIVATEMSCTRCENEGLLVQLVDEYGNCKPASLFTWPEPGGRHSMPGLPHLQALSGPLARSYESALKLYNHAEWGATALTVRHLIEGLAARLLPDKRELPLPRQLDALPRDLDLSRPLQDLSQLMAPDGAFGRHFDDETSIDKVTAEHLLELAEQLLQYLVVMPGEMAELKSRIATAPVPLRRGSGAA
ncbi:hypothetical protein [Lysobacter solisilvae (ex Woo and Kim 2020)]|uniref:DUF4145 domain-containing protein n=1 Tax=Agrilutibacter terrestris TaxID=2865112 RepID=A0A7H0FZJ4_9GAMM|nr:hypothetical protein [Lysobacter terrestris]QNP41460.1 hypothetical protein H8B22_04350 [Lysobacter terrestris]